MKRILMALAATAFVVAAIGIARANSGDSETPTAAPSATSPADISRDRALTTEQVGEQSEQALKAQADLAARVRDAADTSQTLIVTIRENTPGEVWIKGRVDGKPACVTPPKHVPTYVTAYAAGVNDASLAGATMVPLEAELLRSGACQATVELFVPQLTTYEVSIRGAGKGTFDPIVVRKAGAAQKVTLAG